LQILGSELHQNASGDYAPPGSAGGVMALPSPLAVIKGGDEGEGEGNGWK